MISCNPETAFLMDQKTTLDLPWKQSRLLQSWIFPEWPWQFRSSNIFSLRVGNAPSFWFVAYPMKRLSRMASQTTYIHRIVNSPNPQLDCQMHGRQSVIFYLEKDEKNWSIVEPTVTCNRRLNQGNKNEDFSKTAKTENQRCIGGQNSHKCILSWKLGCTQATEHLHHP